MCPLLATLLVLTAAFQVPEHVETWPDGTVRERYEFVRAVDDETGADERIRHGAYESFFENGELEAKGAYEHGLRDGSWTFRWPNGERRSTGRFKAGMRDGKWSFFDERGGKDELGSGTYRAYEALRKDGSGELGATLDKLKHGHWRYVGTGGRPLFEGEYERGVARGTWILRHADGSVEDAWLTGRYERARRVGDASSAELSAPAASPAASPSTWTPDEQLAALVDSVARGDAGAERELALRPRELFPALARRIGRCDLATDTGATEARRLHEALAGICGAGWVWADPDEDGAAQRNRRTALRWGTLWELIRLHDEGWRREAPGGELWERDLLRDELWERDFARKWIPRVDVQHTVLGDPPLPATFEQANPIDDVRPSTGEGFGGRFGGRPSLRAAGGSETEQALQSGAGWLANQVDLGASGALVAWELHALLAFYGDGQRIGREPLGTAIEPLLVRAVLTQADRHAGRAEAPRYLLQRALETEVLAEAARFEKLPAVRQALEWAIRDLLAAQAERGPWPRDLGEARGDAATTALALLALQAAEQALGADAERGAAMETAVAWLEQRVDPKTGAVHADERDPASVHGEPCATAVTAFAFVRAGRARDDKTLEKLLGRLAKHPPRLDRPDYLLHGTNVAYQAGGELWEGWNKELKQLVIAAQGQDGSWPAAAPRDRATTTGLMTQALEVYFRYPRAWGAR